MALIKKFLIVAACLLSSIAHAHLIMKNPIPFGLATLNNSPLNDAKPGTSQSDFPCKLRSGVYDVTAMNYMKVGEPQLLDFVGSASHGGGTCQIAVSLDEQPSANSTFKIIQVFEGGCPIDSDGNSGTHPFTFTIPQGFPNGISTLAWVWYNRIGNREIYMNCAPITVSGGANNLTYFNSLPNLYVINLPTTECESGTGSGAVSIPYPGQFIMQEAAGQSLIAANGPSCSASAAAMTKNVVGYKSSTIATNGAAYTGPATNMDSTGAADPSATAASQLLIADSSPTKLANTASPTPTSHLSNTKSTPASNSTRSAPHSRKAIGTSSAASSAVASGSGSSNPVIPITSASGSPSLTTTTATSASGTSKPGPSITNLTVPPNSIGSTVASSSGFSSATSSVANSSLPSLSATTGASSSESSKAVSSITSSGNSSNPLSSITSSRVQSSLTTSTSVANGSSPAATSSPSAPMPTSRSETLTTTATSGVASPSSGTGSGSQPCSSASAAIQCSADGKQFGVCANGLLVWRPVAMGTRCERGQIQRRDDTVPIRPDRAGHIFWA